jgi:hypothetical protein
MVYLLLVINPLSVYASSVADTGTSDSSDPDPSESDPDPSESDPDPSESDPDPSESDPDPSESDPGPSITISRSDPSDPDPSDPDPSDSVSSDESDPSDDSNSDVYGQSDELVERYISIIPSTDPSAIAQFSPNVLWIAQGTEVNWVNNHDIQHAIHVLDNTAPFGSPILMGSKNMDSFGDSYQLTFDKIGNYAFYCSIHPTMSGTVYVR